MANASTVEWLTLGATTLGLVALFVQMRLEHQRSRRMATIEFYRDTVEAREVLRDRLPNDRDAEALTAFLPDPFSSDTPRHHDILRHLNYFEMLATGTNRHGRGRFRRNGILDLETVDLLAGPRIQGIWNNYGPFIRGRRLLHEEATLYCEIEILASEITKRRKRTYKYSHVFSLAAREAWAAEHGSRIWAADLSLDV
jgi:hypothetical protein